MLQQKNKTYAGIGSRQTPADVLSQMTRIASFMEEQGYVLYSGGAVGADQAFENGVKDPDMRRIFLPWKEFNQNPSSYFGVSKEASVIAKKFHPSWYILPPAAKLLIARNGYQILGKSLDAPVDLVVCYTPDGKASGGTGQAIRIAQHYSIPIFNMYFKKDVEVLLSWGSAGEVSFRKDLEIESWKLM
jgi:hypothetical protein